MAATPMMTLAQFGNAWGSRNTGTTPYDGHRWSFFARDARNSPTLIVMNGTHPACVRSAKMARVEAALVVADAAFSAKRLVQLATLADVTEAKTLIEQLNAAYDLDNSAFRIERVASGYRMLTRPEYSFWLGKLHQRNAELKLSPPALETLAIVAYRQPITRADVEAVRRVQCSDMLKFLMERGLVRIAGEEETLGRPFLYETTKQFLEVFGLRGLDALPMSESLRKTKVMLDLKPDASDAEAESAA